ncbi:hypothetical protein SEA_VIBAKI_74 [Arthrobacter phage Vibaki]|uniref:Uncharacterized protein n=1 Tax=Arthrobacter phage Vibaki TaxID=2593333 RepID=A0A514TZ26_9CAUD|nr:hypothetical protein HYP95_gp74 [Arthrobacter phage Vibaki]QDK01954.1 hypothetical protein SEA_VIBAKI_74 [Arthrobacter phage Vibaki]
MTEAPPVDLSRVKFRAPGAWSFGDWINWRTPDGRHDHLRRRAGR